METSVGQSVDLAAQDGSGSDVDEFVGVVRLNITQHDRRAVSPTCWPQRGSVRDEMEVAVPATPIREVEPFDRLHSHVDREQVVAGMGAVGESGFEEEPCVEPFAQQTAVVIGESDNNRVDRASRHRGVQLSRCHWLVRSIGQIPVTVHSIGERLRQHAGRCRGCGPGWGNDRWDRARVGRQPPRRVRRQVRRPS